MHGLRDDVSLAVARKFRFACVLNEEVWRLILSIVDKWFEYVLESANECIHGLQNFVLPGCDGQYTRTHTHKQKRARTHICSRTHAQVSLADEDLPGAETLRLMRCFRVFRLFKRIKSLHKIMVSLVCVNVYAHTCLYPCVPHT